MHALVRARTHTHTVFRQDLSLTHTHTYTYTHTRIHTHTHTHTHPHNTHTHTTHTRTHAHTHTHTHTHVCMRPHRHAASPPPPPYLFLSLSLPEVLQFLLFFFHASADLARRAATKSLFFFTWNIILHVMQCNSQLRKVELMSKPLEWNQPPGKKIVPECVGEISSTEECSAVDRKEKGRRRR